MAAPTTSKKVIDALNLMNLALTHIRLYPPSSPIIANSANRAFQSLTSVLSEDGSVLITEFGKTYLISGQAIPDKEQRKSPQTMAFLDTVFGFGLKSVEFVKGIRQPEFRSFLEIVGKNPEIENPAKLLDQAIKSNSLPHILTDHKMFVAVDKDRQLSTAADVRDSDIVRHLTGEAELSDADRQKIRNMSKHPDWVEKAFQIGMHHIMEGKSSMPSDKLAQVFIHMIRVLDDILDDAGKEKLASHISGVMADMDDNVLSMILTGDTDGLLGGKFSEHLINSMEDDKFSRVVSRIGLTENSESSAEFETTRTYRSLMATDKGKRLSHRIRERIARDIESKKQRLNRIRQGVGAILKGEITPFDDKEFMQAIPGIIEKMFADGKSEAAKELIRRLSDGLSVSESASGAEAANTLVDISRILIAGKQTELSHEISPRLSDWLRGESRILPASEKTFRYLGELAARAIREFEPDKAAHILESLSAIRHDTAGKEGEVRDLAENTLKSVASGEILTLLAEEFEHNRRGKQHEAGMGLVRLGEFSADILLDILEKSENRAERAQILKLITEIGTKALPALKQRIEQGGAWYYLRNLILILGKIGTEDDLRLLKPLLKHEDIRIRQETLNSIYAIGGKYRGEVLLSALPAADDTMKGVITDMLGALRYENAVPALSEMLESKTLFSSKMEDRLKEKICQALGRIGSSRAVPVLKDIAEQKKLLGISSYGDTVKAAAATALADISRPKPGKTEPTLPKSEALPKPMPKLPASPREPETEKPEPVFRLAPPPKNGEVGAPSDDFRLPPAETSEKKVRVVYFDPAVSRNADTIEESAVQLMFEQIVTFAKEKRFAQAEALREKMIEFDPMALSEIVRSAEIIEMERNEFPDAEQDVNLWPDLDESLSSEEAHAMYEAMEEIVYDADQPVFAQGDRNNRLYFIRQGQLKVVWRQGRQERLLKTLGPGDIAGEDSFFSITFCTSSLITNSRVKMNYLDKDVLASWKERFPQLESKLYEYCFPLIESFYNLLKKKEVERRVHKRIQMPGEITLRLFKVSGQPEGRDFGGSLKDISAGGLAFSLKTSEKTAYLLLGRKLGITAALSAGDIRQDIDAKGMVISVIRRYANTYSIHVRFDAILEETIMENIENLRKNS